MPQYLALLRGINVGGKNIIKMADLKICFESQYFTDVATYIQSGNVIFSSKRENRIKVADKIEKSLEQCFSYEAKIVLLSRDAMDLIITSAPEGFGNFPDIYKYDVIFLRDNLSPADLMKKIKINSDVDSVYAGESVIYFSRLTAKVTQSKLSRVILMPEYKDMTIRNWRTTKQLHSIMSKTS